VYKDIPKMNFNEAYEFLKNTIKILPTKTYMLIGKTGVAKSALIKKLADEFDGILIDRRLANLLPEDISGMPIKKGDHVEFVPIDSMKILFEPTEKPIFLFLDEINLASQEVLKAVFELIYDRTINGKPINPNTYIFAAGNVGDEYNVSEFSPALKRRMNYIELVPDLNEWIEFAKNDIPSFIIKFLKVNSELFSAVKEDVVLSPAQWYELGVAIKKATNMKLDEKFIMNLASSFIGNVSQQLIKFYKSSITMYDLIYTTNYKTVDKNILKDILQDFIKSYRTTENSMLWNDNKNKIVEMFIYLNDDVLLTSLVNTVGIENLDGIKPRQYQSKLLEYVV